MEGIYLDNAATSFPKADGVAENMANYINNIGSNINRGSYSSSYEAENVAYETREILCSLFNFNITENTIFTKNITESLNLLIKGFLKNGDHVLVSSIEHNAVMRPLNSLLSKGITFSRIPCNEEGVLQTEELENFIKPNTRAVIMTHASNVCGTISNLEEVGRICKKHKLFFIIDTAQTAGSLDIDFKGLNADAIAFTGHKGLLGPQGIGGFLINDKLNSQMSPLIEGGTGSLSEYETQPTYMPDKYEAGTLNIPGIYGLNASLKYINKIGISAIRQKELELTKKFLYEVQNIKNIRIIGKKDIYNRTSVVSLDFSNFDNAQISYMLFKQFNIMTRCGLHCAPSAHKALNTFPQGTVRFSFSYFNTFDELSRTIDAIYKVSKIL